MAIHVGYLQAGAPGLLVAGVSFIVPAVVIVTAVAWAYVQFGSLPVAVGLLSGVKPVVVAVVVQALWGLARSAVKTTELGALAVAATIANAMGADELLVLFAAGLVALALRSQRNRVRCAAAAPLFLSPGAIAAAPLSLGALFLFFLKVGSVLFGSGYVLIAFLRADLVGRWHWLSEAQLLDAVAVGQVTPGPVFTTATFIGYVLGGLSGAAVATVGIFLPAFVFVALSGPLVPRLRRSAVAGAFLDGVTVASLALMAVVTCRLAAEAIVDWPAALLASASAVLLLRFRVNSSWLVLGGAVVGLLR